MPPSHQYQITPPIYEQTDLQLSLTHVRGAASLPEVRLKLQFQEVSSLGIGSL